MNASKKIQDYFDNIESGIAVCYNVAEECRKKGFDPENKVDIPLARGISQRVEGLISAVAPQILKSGVSERILVLEEEYGSLDWRVALKIAEDVAKQKFCEFADEKEAMEVGIRVGLAYITLGVIAAPLEGFIELKIKNTNDGKKYLSTFFAGPIRAAGGTAAAVTLLITDFVRIKMGYAKYDPSESEVKRYITEIQDYHERVTNLQYFPSNDEIEFLAKHLPVEVNGDPTEVFEVSNHKDLPRVETNRIRGGVCLVIAEGLCQKAPKLFKQIAKWGSDLGLEWNFLQEFLEIQKIIKAKGNVAKNGEDQPKITPNYTYIKDLVAGRPILCHPLKPGGFRLRYGRTRTSGFASHSLHPATLYLLNDYIATGTQLKTERPGKATVISPCDYVEGPIIRMKSGDVIQVESDNNIREIVKNMDQIIFLGDILINYGDFSENGHVLVPAGYCEEWWIQEFEKNIINKFEILDLEKTSAILEIEVDKLQLLIDNPIKTPISCKEAIYISTKLGVPLHPKYCYFWNNISKDELKILLDIKKNSNFVKDNDEIIKIVIPLKDDIKSILEKIGIIHKIATNEFIIVEKREALILFISLGGNNNLDFDKIINESKDVLQIINIFSGLIIRDKMGTFIGARMGRPEKAKQRKLIGKPHVLFPIGEEGGRLKSFQAALLAGKVTADFPIYTCLPCNNKTIMTICEKCGLSTNRIYHCKICGFLDSECKKNDEKYGKHKSVPFNNQEIDINYYFNNMLKNYNIKIYPDLIKGVRGTSNKNHEPEHLLKGILRAMHDVYVNKDGTTRYDMIEMPITHFKSIEIGTPIEKLKELGYLTDIKGNELVNEDQILELFPQDHILPNSPESPDEFSSAVLLRVCDFIDDLLVKLYKNKPFYNTRKKEDLVGHLIIGLAPHTSAGMVGRIIGFSQTQGMYCHPMFHAAMRRNCDGDEACVMMLMDALLNFSRSFLPDRRGSRTMDAPLVLTSILVPSEVDDEVHGMDIVWNYPLELYEAALEYKKPWDVKVTQIDHVLDTEKQYEGMGFTHDTTNINSGVRCSAYKTLPSMQEKLAGQMALAERICAVDETDVARLVIEKHFLKDIKGNLRKFSMQEFRCVKCNEKFRRPPLVGMCIHCGGKIIFTISQGSVVKYLEPAISLGEKYEVSVYLKQTLELLRRMIDEVFGKDPEKQMGLGSWFEK